MIETEVVKLPNWTFDVPLSIHLLINSECNLRCPKCYYKAEGEIAYPQFLSLFGEWKRAGVKSIAIGGGEPMLHPNIEQVCKEAKLCGFYLAITTNGTIIKRVWADRLHISFDEIHRTDFEQTRRAIRCFRQFIPKIGINHIVTDLQSLKRALKLPADTYTLLMEKPESKFDEWEKAFALVPKEKLWIDACLAQKLGIRKCRQGVTSMSINQQLQAAKCSNMHDHIPYNGLKATWNKIKQQPCPFWVKM